MLEKTKNKEMSKGFYVLFHIKSLILILLISRNLHHSMNENDIKKIVKINLVSHI